MNSSDLIQGHSYLFNVIKESSGWKYFKVATSDGKEFSLMKFKFQMNQPLPDSLRCYVKSMYPVTLGQDLNPIINKFYVEGHEYDFIVKSERKSSDKYYELEDEHGLCFKLVQAPVSLAKGISVKCRVVRICGVNVVLKYVGKLSYKISLDFYDISRWLENIGIYSRHETYERILESIPEFGTALDMYDNDEAMWIFELLRVSIAKMPEWLIACKNNLKALKRVCDGIDMIKNIALYILEESDYLRNCNHEQRSQLQTRLSHNVELCSQYTQAGRMILEGTHTNFIDRMFSRLKEAGYLYHPSKQFRIMMTILKLCPELINSRMGELFEALHSWDISNWSMEPFRPALVEQLQIFIKENATKVNNLPANDSSDENKTIIRIVLAIAVQRLLATDKDNIDLNLNRAMLYRYISYLIPGSMNALLNKSLDSLLGIDFPNEYSWHDTDQPTLLLVKSSHPSPESEGRDVITKIYSTSKAEVRLKSDTLQIIAKDAEEDSTSVPMGLFDWPVTLISLAEPLQTKNIRKSKDLKVFKQMWDDIAWSIFGEDVVPKDEVSEKRLPCDGEEVKIMIDDVRIFDNLPDKQRLQFHCTICDEMFKGDGWLPCDTFHMLGWLSYKDIPGNYDGSISFSQNRDGQPLLYTAKAYRKQYGLQFNIKNEVDNFLLENSSSDQELIGIVTHYDNKNDAWLCLTEMGSTFKIFNDESNKGILSKGKLVRVKYVEPDRSNSFTQLFIGELSENQDNLPLTIKKSLCLCNLMQSLGEDPTVVSEESFEVRETEEVMSKEGLLELIYIYQRRAYTETEYLKAYNYLGVATILCRLAEEDSLLETLTLHMHFLQLLYDFGKNQKIDVEELDICEARISNIPMLERLHSRLKIVSDIDINENAENLWKISKNPRNETEGKLASLVLSYNMLPRDLEKPRKDIMKEITTVLNVNNAVSSSKYYGDESQTVEFKSSVVYSSKKGSRPDLKTQMHEIIHIVCGFMNARGGSLFIGVNDAGYETGLDDDLAYMRANGKKATLDGLVVELQNNLDRKLPPHAKDHCEISIDPEARKGVIELKVLPVELPVELDGMIYVRSSSTTKPRLEKEREEFIKNRSHNYHLLMKLWGVENEETKDVEIKKEESPSPILSEDQGKVLVNAKVISTEINSHATLLSGNQVDVLPDNKVRIGKNMHNVLHNYEMHYITPSYYLYIWNDNSFTRSEKDHYWEADQNCGAAIAVKEQQLKGVMILSFEDSKVVKLPMCMISDIVLNEKGSFRKESQLKNINIGQEEDYLLSIIQAISGEIFYKIIKVSSLIMSSELEESGMSLCDNEHKILAQEIFSSDKLNFFNPDALKQDRRFYGIPVPNNGGTLTREERIKELLRPLLIVE